MSEWKKITIADFFEYTVPGEWGINPEMGNTIQVIRSTNFTNTGKLDLTDIAFRTVPQNKLEKRLIHKNDTLIEKSGGSPDQPVGRVIFVDVSFPCTCSNFIELCRPKTLYDKQYVFYKLFYCYITGLIYRYQQQTTGIINFKLNQYLLEQIDCPTSLPEQRKIARILSTVDAVIEKSEAAIAKYKAIKSGMMRDFFTRGIDLKTGKLRPSYEDAPELYKQSELGWVPKEWYVDALENSTDYVDYRGKTPPKSEFGIFLVTARNIKEGFIDYENSKEYIPEYAYESAMSRGKAEIGDIVITTEAPMGNVAQINRNHIALAQRVIKYRGKSNKLVNNYLAIFLMSDGFQRRLIAESTGSTVLGIKGSRLHKLLVTILEKDEQIAISKMINAQNALLTIENEILLKNQQLKSALMSDLLTGKVRVKYEEETAEAQ